MTELSVACGLAMLCSYAASGQTGTISGSVRSDGSVPLSNITVLYKSFNLAGSRVASIAVNSSVVTDQNGNFQIGGLPAGTFYVCALASSAGQLSSCRHGARPVYVVVSAGGQSGGVALTISTGQIVRVRVTGAIGSISAAHRFSVAAMASDGSFEIGKQVSQSAQELDFEITIPENLSSYLMINTDLNVTDGSGNPIAVQRPVIPLPTSSPSTVSLVLQ